MPKARLVFDGDNVYIGKDARIYGLKNDIATKIDGIPGVVDNLNSTSTTDALSANMGRDLQDQINSMSGIGTFLSAWDCTTGLPETNPQQDPYTYKVGDYYVVSTVGATNYKPHGGTFTQGVPSTTVETENVGINDKYYFDGADWVRIPNAAIQITIDSALSVSSTNAVENRAIVNAVNAKQDIISDLNTIRSGASAGATALQPNDNISQLTNNVGYQTAGDVASAIAGKQDILSAGDGISISNNTVTNTKPGPAISGTAPSNPTEGTLWYDSTNDVLKVYDGSAWQEVGSDAADINTKTFYLSSTSDLTNAQAAYDWFLAGKNPIIVYNNISYTLRSVVDNSNIAFMGYRTQETIGGDKTVSAYKTVQFTINSNVVTAIILNNDFDQTAYLSTNVNYTSPYIPQYPGSPATKKYVDDSVADIISSGSTQPANPQEGDLWYDTVNHVLKIYNGTSWETVDTDTNTTYTAGNGINIDANNEISVDTTIIPTQTDLAGKQDVLTAGDNIQISAQNIISATDTTYTAGPGIMIGDYSDYSAVRGPCNDGYHVPLQSEWEDVQTQMINLGLSTGDDWKDKLHLPLSGFRSQLAITTYQGSVGRYRTVRSNGTSAYALDVGRAGTERDYKINGYSIRPFKNSSVTPDNTWTMLFDGSSVATGAGIFHNTTLGLISISGDGATWITIADKNLGASSVYNNGASLGEANCGYYYQWGNNYGFPRTGTISDTSSTQVNASTYGPENYYSSSTYIIANAQNWDSSNNANLRGGATGITIIQDAITADKDYITVGGWTSLGNFVTKCSQNGTRHETHYSNENTPGMWSETYTFRGTGWFWIRDFHGASAAASVYINGTTVLYENTGSGTYDVKHRIGPFTMGAGDTVTFNCTAGGSSGSVKATVYDYY